MFRLRGSYTTVAGYFTPYLTTKTMPKVPDYVPPKACKKGNYLVVNLRGTKKRKFFDRYSDLTAWDSYREWTVAWQAGKIDKNTGEPTLASSSGG